VQKEADKQGKGNKWQDIAAANNIENPRLLQPGQLIDMNASVQGGVSFGASVSLSGGAALQGGVTAQAGLTTGAGASLQGGASIESGVSVGVDLP
jgi:UDP-3-O-[3-hydroxymyristoyl] glucosamine N-acyltransferase